MAAGSLCNHEADGQRRLGLFQSRPAAHSEVCQWPPKTVKPRRASRSASAISAARALSRVAIGLQGFVQAWSQPESVFVDAARSLVATAVLIELLLGRVHGLADVHARFVGTSACPGPVA